MPHDHKDRREPSKCQKFRGHWRSGGSWGWWTACEGHWWRVWHDTRQNCWLAKIEAAGLIEEVRGANWRATWSYYGHQVRGAKLWYGAENSGAYNWETPRRNGAEHYEDGQARQQTQDACSQLEPLQANDAHILRVHCSACANLRPVKKHRKLRYSVESFKSRKLNLQGYSNIVFCKGDIKT